MSTPETETQAPPKPPSELPSQLILGYETADPVTNLPGHIDEALGATSNLVYYANKLGNLATGRGATGQGIDGRGTSLDDKAIPTIIKITPTYPDYETLMLVPKPRPDRPLIHDDPATAGMDPTPEQDIERRENASSEGLMAVANFLGNIALEETKALPNYTEFVTNHFQDQRNKNADDFIEQQNRRKASLFPSATPEEFSPNLTRGFGRNGLPAGPKGFFTGHFDYVKNVSPSEGNPSPDRTLTRAEKRAAKLEAWKERQASVLGGLALELQETYDYMAEKREGKTAPRTKEAERIREFKKHYTRTRRRDSLKDSAKLIKNTLDPRNIAPIHAAKKVLRARKTKNKAK